MVGEIVNIIDTDIYFLSFYDYELLMNQLFTFLSVFSDNRG